MHLPFRNLIKPEWRCLREEENLAFLERIMPNKSCTSGLLQMINYALNTTPRGNIVQMGLHFASYFCILDA